MPILGSDDSVLTPRVPTEHESQRLFVQWFRRKFEGVRIFAIPNGGARGRAQGGRLKAEGVSAGVPDLLVPAWMVWIEMKREDGGTVSPAQRDWHAYLESIGHKVLICRGLEDAMKKVLALA